MWHSRISEITFGIVRMRPSPVRCIVGERTVPLNGFCRIVSRKAQTFRQGGHLRPVTERPLPRVEQPVAPVPGNQM